MSLRSNTTDRFTIADVQSEFNHTQSWLDEHPTGAPFQEKFKTFQSRIDGNLAQERKLQQVISAATVRAVLVDRALNAIAKEVIALIPVQKDQDPAVLQGLLLGGQPLSKFSRPLLGAKLKTMKDWVSPLKSSSLTRLQELGQSLEAKVQAATQAEESLNPANAALEEFLTIGDRPQLFADFNALRNTVYTGVGAVDNVIAEEFFLHDTSQTVTLEAATLTSQAKVEKLAALLEAEKQKLADLQAEKKARDEEEAKRQSAETQLAQIKQQEALLKQQKKQLKTQAGKGRKKK
jgi:hypothetical protein